ncbi:MAG: hypothetical protein EBU46_14195 [Nitrosomonadaceae bacterium]|nr:hypothetical protein [Nitrosomonadaceae bacterium]
MFNFFEIEIAIATAKLFSTKNKNISYDHQTYHFERRHRGQVALSSRQIVDQQSQHISCAQRSFDIIFWL